MAEDIKTTTPAPTPPPQGKGEQPTVEEHARELGLEPWQYEGLRVRENWPEGWRISRAKFEAALEAWLKGDTDGNLEKGGE